MHFGDEFKKLITGSGLTYEEVAAGLGYKRKSNISYWIKSKKSPNHDKIVEICNFFGVSKTYFDEDAQPEMDFHQPQTEYRTEKHTIPVMSGETTDAVKVGEVSVPYLGIDDGFAIVVDDRLEELGFQQGSTLFLSKKFDLASTCKVVAQQGAERFFATYEKRGNHAVILPLDHEKPPLTPEGAGVTVYAVLKHILIEV